MESKERVSKKPSLNNLGSTILVLQDQNYEHGYKNEL
jgi:hypothetical protein